MYVPIDEEIQLVMQGIVDAAKHTLPLVKHKKQTFFKDPTLKQICDKSKRAWKAWVDADRPPDGPLYDSKNHWRRRVSKRVNFCAVMNVERWCVRMRENMFRSGERNRFHAPNKKKPRCSKHESGQ